MAGEVEVHFACAAASAGYGVDYERLPALHVATCEDFVDAAFKCYAGLDVSEGVVFNFQVVEEAFVLRVYEAHGKEDDVGGDCKF